MMSEFLESYDVAVIGAGHAGIEAALASARLGCKTIIFTINNDAVGNCPCNPSIGGPAKGIVVREIDALGGEMGRKADKGARQLKRLNTKKCQPKWMHGVSVYGIITPLAVNML